MLKSSSDQDPFLENLQHEAEGYDVAYLGPEDSFSEIMATRLFGSDPTTRISRSPHLRREGTLSDIVDTVRHIPRAFGIMPYENSKTQPVQEAVDSLFSMDFTVLHEARLRLDLVLAGTGLSVDRVQEVYSHEKAIGQSQKFIKDGKLIAVPRDSTSEAAEYVAQKKDDRLAALCSKAAARRLGLNLLEIGVQDAKHNATRFLTIRSADATEPDIQVLRNKRFERLRPRLAKVIGIVSPKEPASKNGFLAVGDMMRARGIIVRVPTGTRNNESSRDDDHQDHLMEFEARDDVLFELLKDSANYDSVMDFKLIGAFAVGKTYTEPL